VTVSSIRKSDHSLLSIDCKLQTANVKITVKCNYNKGVDDGMRQSIQINWKEFLSSLHEIDTMWMVYKQKFRDSNLQLIHRLQNSWKEEGWIRPQNFAKLQENFFKTVNYRAHIWTLVIKLYFKNINQSITKLEMKHVNRETGQCCIHWFGKSIWYHP